MKKSSHITFIRKYTLGQDMNFYQVFYDSGRCRTYAEYDMPKTVRDYIEASKARRKAKRLAQQ